MTKEILLKAVENATSYNQILKNLGKSTSGAAVKLLKKQLEEFKIEVLFNNYKKCTNFSKKPIEYYLQNNISCDSKSLKKRLIKEGLKENKCEICGCSGIWNNLPITLQLDHVNGNHCDNRLENLRILCPNCHSQTKTWGMKNRNVPIE